MKALIVGGGVGGMAAAVALRRVGVEVEVFERAAEIRDIGAGKSLWSNGVEALRALGITDEVTRPGSPIEEIRVLGWNGRVFHRIPVRRFGTSLALMRSQVLEPLARLAFETARVHTDSRCVGFEASAGGVTMALADGQSVRGDLLVGADGIFSSVRRVLFPGWEPRYAGHVAWRGIARHPQDRWRLGVSYNWYGRGEHFAVIPLRDERVFWYATKNLPVEAEGDGLDEVLTYFEAGVDGAADVMSATAPSDLVRNRLYDLPFRRTWASGRVVLIGDAAHAMRPNLGQGACTAIEDAVVLARTLTDGQDVPDALRRFVTRRRRRVWWIHRWSEITSRSQLIENRALCRLRDLYLWLQPGPLIARTFVAPLLRFEPTP